MKTRQTHRHAEKLGSGGLSSPLEKLQHLAQRVSYIQLSGKVGLLHVSEQGPRVITNKEVHI